MGADLVAVSRVLKTGFPPDITPVPRNNDGVYFVLLPAAKAQFVAGEDPIWIEGWLEREVGGPLSLARTDAVRMASVSVRMTDKPVPMTSAGVEELNNSQMIQFSSEPFVAENPRRFSVHLNRMFDLSRSGTYSIRLTTSYFHPEKGEAKIESNPIQIEIVKPKGPTWQVPVPKEK